MSYHSRLKKARKGAIRLPLGATSKYVLFSDCHRGTGNANDNFLKNNTLYIAALRHYYRTNYTYIELGDGDELWENKRMKAIIENHTDAFRLLSCFYEQGRFFSLYGNHDMRKKKRNFPSKHCRCFSNRPDCISSPEDAELFSNMVFHEGIILENPSSPNNRSIFLTHGHQADLLNSVFWKLSRFLVRYFWKPLERFGVLDPTSAAKNNTRKRKTEIRLQHFALKENLILIAGHTHRPVLDGADLSYCNTGSCVHPYSITCLEIERMHIRLIKWTLSARQDMSLFVTREILSGPFPIH